MVERGFFAEVIRNAPKENVINEERKSFNAYFDDPEKQPSSLQKEKQSQLVKEEDDFVQIELSDLKGT